MAHTLAEVQVERPADTLCDGKALELLEVLAFVLAGKKVKRTCRDTRRDVEVKAFVKTVADRVAEVMA